MPGVKPPLGYPVLWSAAEGQHGEGPVGRGKVGEYTDAPTGGVSKEGANQQHLQEKQKLMSLGQQACRRVLN